MAGKQVKRRARSGDALVGDLVAFIRDYVVMSDEKLLVLALWIIHTHIVRAFDQTPYLAITSPEKQCGKSRLLEVLELLVARPWMITQPSEAVVYRYVSKVVPTLLFDEVDTIFNPKTADRHEGLRALLNAGHRRGAVVPRAMNFGKDVEHFSVFCPKVLAGIGTLPDTIADRSIPIRLERKTRSEKVTRFSHREAEPRAEALTDRIDAWTSRNETALTDARPEMPAQLSDRMQEGCEPVVAIADILGRGDDARAGLVSLLTSERLDSQETMRVRLLRDLRTIFDRHAGARSAFTDSLITELFRMEESGWDSYYRRGIEPKDLASLLRHYGVSPTTVRKKEKVAKGYKRDDLQPVWERYLDDA
jgi:hypothetical protein